MATSDRRRIRVSRAAALFAVLAITTGWTTPAQAPASATMSSHGAARASSATSAATLAAMALARADAAQDPVPSAAWALRPTSASYHTTTANRHWPRVEQAKPVEKAPVKAKATTPAKTHTTTPKAPAPTHKPTYHGTNHFWIPSLGMSYGVRNYACGRTTTPLNYIYRWGCAGTNNVYLLGHAWGVMKPLHDLYVSGGLHRGMVAVFADASGRVRTYKVTEWRVVRPTQIAWQIAAQPVPSMTLQTCIGAQSQYRLNVRLVAVN